MKLIDKDALVAEIERLKNTSLEYGYTAMSKVLANTGKDLVLGQLLRNLDTLEVKEIDLEKELDKEWNKCVPIDEGMGLEIASIEHEQFDNIAKHFFELGVKAQKGE